MTVYQQNTSFSWLHMSMFPINSLYNTGQHWCMSKFSTPQIHKTLNRYTTYNYERPWSHHFYVLPLLFLAYMYFNTIALCSQHIKWKNELNRTYMCMSTKCSIHTCFMGSGMFCHNSLLFHYTANDNNVPMLQHT
jgi:hypothetical protein